MSQARDKIANKPGQGVGNRGNPGNAEREPNQNVNHSVDRNGGEGVNRVENPGGAGQKSDQNVNPHPNPSGRKDTSRVDSIPVGLSLAQDQMDPETDQLLILKDLGSLNRDERRLSATFNYSRGMRYLVLVDDVLRALDKVARKEHEKMESASGDVSTLPVEKKVVFPRGTFISMFKAAIMGLVLQCGTIAGAMIIIVFTPTVGLGCRSLGYTIYGGIAIIIMFLTIISTIFARISETREERSFVVKGFAAFIAIALRWISFLLALINGVGLIALSCFQFSHLLDNCYCNASVLSRGTDSYMIIFYNGSVTTMRNSRLFAILISGTVMLFYMVFLRLMTLLPRDLDDN